MSFKLALLNTYSRDPLVTDYEKEAVRLVKKIDDMQIASKVIYTGLKSINTLCMSLPDIEPFVQFKLLHSGNYKSSELLFRNYYLCTLDIIDAISKYIDNMSKLCRMHNSVKESLVLQIHDPLVVKHKIVEDTSYRQIRVELVSSYHKLEQLFDSRIKLANNLIGVLANLMTIEKEISKYNSRNLPEIYNYDLTYNRQHLSTVSQLIKEYLKLFQQYYGDVTMSHSQIEKQRKNMMHVDSAFRKKYGLTNEYFKSLNPMESYQDLHHLYKNLSNALEVEIKNLESQKGLMSLKNAQQSEDNMITFERLPDQLFYGLKHPKIVGLNSEVATVKDLLNNKVQKTEIVVKELNDCMNLTGEDLKVCVRDIEACRDGNPKLIQKQIDKIILQQQLSQDQIKFSEILFVMYDELQSAIKRQQMKMIDDSQQRQQDIIDKSVHGIIELKSMINNTMDNMVKTRDTIARLLAKSDKSSNNDIRNENTQERMMLERQLGMIDNMLASMFQQGSAENKLKADIRDSVRASSSDGNDVDKLVEEAMGMMYNKVEGTNAPSDWTPNEKALLGVTAPRQTYTPGYSDYHPQRAFVKPSPGTPTPVVDNYTRDFTPYGYDTEFADPTLQNIPSTVGNVPAGNPSAQQMNPKDSDLDSNASVVTYEGSDSDSDSDSGKGKQPAAQKFQPVNRVPTQQTNPQSGGNYQLTTIHENPKHHIQYLVTDSIKVIRDNIEQAVAIVKRRLVSQLRPGMENNKLEMLKIDIQVNKIYNKLIANKLSTSVVNGESFNNIVKQIEKNNEVDVILCKLNTYIDLRPIIIRSVNNFRTQNNVILEQYASLVRSNYLQAATRTELETNHTNFMKKIEEIEKLLDTIDIVCSNREIKLHNLMEVNTSSDYDRTVNMIYSCAGNIDSLTQKTTEMITFTQTFLTSLINSSNEIKNRYVDESLSKINFEDRNSIAIIINRGNQLIKEIITMMHDYNSINENILLLEDVYRTTNTGGTTTITAIDNIDLTDLKADINTQIDRTIKDIQRLTGPKGQLERLNEKIQNLYKETPTPMFVTNGKPTFDDLRKDDTLRIEQMIDLNIWDTERKKNINKVFDILIDVEKHILENRNNFEKFTAAQLKHYSIMISVVNKKIIDIYNILNNLNQKIISLTRIVNILSKYQYNPKLTQFRMPIEILTNNYTKILTLKSIYDNHSLLGENASAVKSRIGMTGGTTDDVVDNYVTKLDKIKKYMTELITNFNNNVDSDYTTISGLITTTKNQVKSSQKSLSELLSVIKDLSQQQMIGGADTVPAQQVASTSTAPQPGPAPTTQSSSASPQPGPVAPNQSGSPPTSADQLQRKVVIDFIYQNGQKYDLVNMIKMWEKNRTAYGTDAEFKKSINIRIKQKVCAIAMMYVATDLALVLMISQLYINNKKLQISKNSATFIKQNIISSFNEDGSRKDQAVYKTENETARASLSVEKTEATNKLKELNTNINNLQKCINRAKVNSVTGRIYSNVVKMLSLGSDNTSNEVNKLNEDINKLFNAFIVEVNKFDSTGDNSLNKCLEKVNLKGNPNRLLDISPLNEMETWSKQFDLESDYNTTLGKVNEIVGKVINKIKINIDDIINWIVNKNDSNKLIGNFVDEYNGLLKYTNEMKVADKLENELKTYLKTIIIDNANSIKMQQQYILDVLKYSGMKSTDGKYSATLNILSNKGDKYFDVYNLILENINNIVGLQDFTYNMIKPYYKRAVVLHNQKENENNNKARLLNIQSASTGMNVITTVTPLVLNTTGIFNFGFN